ncbi:hypothetical protein Dxin01_02963 [Deinococcus xinjiangensis]|uniref:PEGA domain-containing protein n=1 Tax=Deinococcus xinjiangensis TaxID=457454 RepID=A0ABP9VGK2_9DEIO
MKSIGPYIVVREVSPAFGANRPEYAQTPRTFWAKDRLTGIPALLHELPSPMPAPELPPHPALLPFSDLVVEGSKAFFVTEMPLHATPALDPMLTARSTLAALDELHRHGFAHGGIDTGQVWSADGHALLAGAGLHPLGSDYTVARDLRDLAHTLERLGGLPPILSLLRDAPDSLTARDALDLLGHDWPVGRQAAPLGAAGSTQPTYTSSSALLGGAPAEQSPAAPQGGVGGLAGFGGLRGASLPPLHPMSLLDNSAPLPQSGHYLWQASWSPLESSQTLQPAPAATMSSTNQPAPHAGEAFNLDVSQWDFPDFLEQSGPEAQVPAPTPLVVTAPPTVLQWAAPNRPIHPPVSTAPPASHPSEAAPLGEQEGLPTNTVVYAPAPAPVADEKLNTASVEGLAPPASEPPSRPRNAKAAASRALERLRADAGRQQALAEARRDHVPAQWQALASGQVPPLTEAPPAETPQERRRREQAALQEQAEFDAKAAAERRAAAEASAAEGMAAPHAEAASAATSSSTDHSASPVSRRQLKPIKAKWTEDGRWEVIHDGDTATPTARPAWLLPALGAVVALVLLGAVLALANRNRQPAPAAACCDVQFAVLGNGNASTATLTLDEAPDGSGLSLGQTLGTVPGSVHFPAQGRYVVRVSAAGFTPARLTLQVPPVEQPVKINLGQ